MINVGIAGYGYWGPNLARSMAETGAARVEMIADQSKAARSRASLRHPSARLTGDLFEMIRDPNVDAVMIATPVQTHYDLAMAALKAGKHVFVEKPLTDNVATAQELVNEAARRNLVLMVDHTFIYTGAVQKISDLIRADELGEVYYYDSTRVNLGLFQHDVNVIWDLAVHDFAIMDHLIPSRATAISASAASFISDSPENMAHLTVYYESGAMAHLNVNWLAPVKIRQTVIGGSRKMVIYDDMQPSEKVKIYDRGASLNQDNYEHLISYRLGDMYSPAISSREALLAASEEFLRCIETGATPITDGHNGLRVVEMLAAASRSVERRGHPIDLVQLKVA
ncbi:Gfo/Idh/MocA family protein [Tropicimonas isoalkanivorans]|uniref:Predicted dehydrogenase n=1 Tax=Tropicimonas isoalkanivorans TaxID=441112 RepID=A0A1I1LL91_9RHOB|nr:Gfo/Idh/MocA family oxidoreductase [Tropicimonas isoalkanivorans]SFC73967.1 Predicted dehydrogenase [Tropicimonas isoalkanivorans]